MKTVGKNMIKECRHNLTACLENFYSGPRTESRSEKTPLRRLGWRIGKTRRRQAKITTTWAAAFFSVCVRESEPVRDSTGFWLRIGLTIFRVQFNLIKWEHVRA